MAGSKLYICGTSSFKRGPFQFTSTLYRSPEKGFASFNKKERGVDKPVAWREGDFNGREAWFAQTTFNHTNEPVWCIVMEAEVQ